MGKRSRSKRYVDAKATASAGEKFPVPQAVSALKGMASAGFDETVDLVLKLGIDPKQSDQNVRGSFALPKGTGKDVRVIVFAEGERAAQAEAAGAVAVGGEDLAKRIEGGWLDFDVAIASPDMMRHVGKLGRILGPQGKMPSPKSGTVTPDVATAVTEFKGGKIEYRNDSFGNIHAAVGKLSFLEDDLVANINAFIGHINSARPAAAKGVFIEKAAVSATMSPSVRLAV